MLRIITFIILVFVYRFATAQQYMTHSGTITFYSHAAIEDITAANKKVSSVINPATNEIAFSVPIKSFIFQKELMQEHFNEKYMESEKFPTATFSGTIAGYDHTLSDAQQVIATGDLAIHGIKRQVSVRGTIQNLADQIRVKTKFIVRLADHNITIPTLLWQNIAEQVEVRVEITYPK
ncbi:MAG TPA: YceI family protein [Ohtaekwangia sp.]|nr:YceI family protein [Ohtaekwangia sp.]